MEESIWHLYEQKFLWLHFSPPGISDVRIWVIVLVCHSCNPSMHSLYVSVLFKPSTFVNEEYLSLAQWKFAAVQSWGKEDENLPIIGWRGYVSYLCPPASMVIFMFWNVDYYILMSNKYMQKNYSGIFINFSLLGLFPPAFQGL